MSTAEIFESARKLRADVRLQLIDVLLESLDETDPAIQGAWTAEAQDRLAAYERGDLSGGPIEELIAKLRTQ